MAHSRLKRANAVDRGAQRRIAWSVFRFNRIIVASPDTSWFETREDALLTMRV
jgi:hypothetical protein